MDFRRFIPALAPISGPQQLRAVIGAMLGILATGLLSSWLVGVDGGAPWLIAPMGASAVLLFAAPSSPLAQPWSIIGGNLVPGLVGVTVARLVPDLTLAAGFAVGLSIAAMFVLRCLHPPGGAVALTAVLGPPALKASGYLFLLSPVLLNSLLLLIVALIWNSVTGHPYPHLRPKAQMPDTRPTALPVLALSDADLTALLSRLGEVVDLSPDELRDLMVEAESRAAIKKAAAAPLPAAPGTGA